MQFRAYIQILALLGINNLNATQTAQKLETEVARKVSIGYQLYLPEKYEAEKDSKWPVILFLHGAGERGDNLEQVTVHGPPKLVRNGQDLPFVIISPQCPKNQIWDNEALVALLDHVLVNHRCDPARVYLTGLSMGGFGTFSLGLTHPDKFAAIAPVCGGGEWIKVYAAKRAKPEDFKTLGVWAFHGGKDNVVKPEQSQRMIDALKKAGCKDVQLTIYPEAGHDSWTKTYDNPKLFEWFLSHSR
jgi:predicted peptidase